MAAIFFLLVGGTLMLKLWFLKIPFILLGLGLITSRDKLAVDFENRRIMKYVQMFGIKIGKWENVSQARYIALVRIRMSRSENFLTIGTQRTKILVKANLIFSNKKYITLFKLKADKAFEIVKVIATGFELDIMDFTRKRKRKISPNVLHVSFSLDDPQLDESRHDKNLNTDRDD